MKNRVMNIAKVLFVFISAIALFTVADALTASGIVMAVGAVVSGGTVTQQGVTGGDSYVETTEYLDMRDVERKVAEYKQYQTPLLSILSQNSGTPTESWEHKYYAVDARGMETTVTSATTISSATTTLTVSDGSIFTRYNTVFFPELTASSYALAGTGNFLMGVITGFPATNQITVKLINPAVALVASDFTSKKIYRGGSAHNETAASTTPWGIIPETDYNYVQIFMEQVEQSEYQKLMKKEADWGFNDLKRLAIEDFKMQRERTFLAGVRGVTNITVDGQTKRFYTCGGFLNDTGIPVYTSLDLSDMVSAPATHLVPLLKTIFTGNNGSKERYLFAGADFIESLEKVNFDDKWLTARDKKVDMGINFIQLVSHFGTLNVTYYEQLDLLNKQKTAIVIDKANIFVSDLKGKGFNVRPLDYKSTGIANVDAAVIEQASTLLIKNKSSHHIINATA